MNELMLVAGAGLLLLLLFLIPTITTSHRRNKRAAIDKQFVDAEWQKITAMANKPDQTARYAIIEADKLLDYTLKQRGYSGETMGERLKSAGNDFSYIDDVWQAHKLRNKLVHESEYQVDQRLIKRAIGQFEIALKDMGAL